MTGTIKLPETTPNTELGFPIHVQVYIPQMQCVALSPQSGSNNERDAICLFFSGRTPASLERGRLPRCVSNDSYYEYWVGRVNKEDKDWTNHDQAPVGRPMIWTGTLRAGQSAEFLVTIMQQDNNGIGTLKELLETGLNAADTIFGSNVTTKPIITTDRELVKYLPESKGHDLIGAFAIQLANVGGKLQTAFVPIQGEMMPDGPSNPASGIASKEKGQAALFDCMGGHGVHYRVIAAARIGPPLPVRIYLSKEIDRCGEALLAVEGGPGKYTGFYHIGKGRAAWVPVAAPRFAWYCQTSKEWTTAPDGTNLVHAHRSAGIDRQIIWYCYHEDEQSYRPAYKPNRTWVKLSTEIDQCGAGQLAVEGLGGFYHLAAGQQRWVPLHNRQFRWYGDTSPAYTTAPEETNLVLAKQSTPLGRISWEYCREIVSLQPYTNPDDTKVLIGLATGPRNLHLINIKEATMTTPHISAALNWNNGKAYFFDGWNYYRYDIAADQADPGYPKPIAGNWPGLWPDGIDAAVVWNNEKAYFFKGSSYVRYDIAADAVDPGYPKPIAGNWPGLWPDGIDAAVVWNNEKAYFFKGMYYVRYDIATDKVERGYPKLIAGNWPGLWPYGIDAAIVWNPEKAYFFKGAYYVRYDIAADKADPGYPQPIAGNWPGMTGEMEYFTYEINEVPDLDQRWDALPKNGGMYCVPTSTLNWMYYLANHGRPGAITYRPADPNIASLVLLNLTSMGNYMDTDPVDGTNSTNAFDGLVDWLDDHHVPAFVTAQRARDGADLTYGDIKSLAFRSALVVIGQGRYQREGSEFVRHGGHAMSMVGFKRNGDRMEIIVHDPADDKANLNTQSAAVDRSSPVTEETRNIEGASIKVLRWGASSSPYYLFIDGWTAIQPLFALTNSSAKMLISHNADILTGAITTTQFSLPVDGELLDLAIHPSKYQASVIAHDSGAIWTLDLAEGIWNKTATVAAPQFLTYGGRDHRLFVVQGSEILSFDNAGKPLDRLDAGVAIDALSYDAQNDRLVVACVAAKRILSVAPALKVLEHIEAPEVSGTGRLLLSANGRDATIVLTRQGSPEVTTLRWHSTGALVTGRFRLLARGPTAAAHINRKGQLFVNEAGKIATFDTDGNRIPGSALDGLQAGPLLKVARSSHNLDEARSRRKEWMN